MENGWTRTVLTGVFLAVILAAVGVSKFYGVGSLSQITVVNRSAETISDARLKQGDRETPLGQIEPGRMRSANFIPREGSLTLTVTFGSGRGLSADDVGYVTPGIPVIVFFNVTDDKVALLDVVKRNPKTQ